MNADDQGVTLVRVDLFEVGMKPRSRQSRDSTTKNMVNTTHFHRKGADGAKGMVRKPLELTLLGSTVEDNDMEFWDIRLEVEGLARDVRAH